MKTVNAKRVSPAVTNARLRSLHKQWVAGKRSKIGIEEHELGNVTARGKVITRLWAKLGLDSTR